MTKEDQNIEKFYAGDNKIIKIPVVDEDGQPFDMTSATAEWVLKENPWDTTALISKSTASGITFSSFQGTNDQVEIALVPADTATLITEEQDGKRFYHECEVTDTGGKVATVATGYITIKRSAT
ncbi:MAG: hypothetical protein DWQ07_12810 [Chloroflexi bacterium]|nr:MAG: hypothetical protein DWQ07_12810 [Chloroflexota bacterium]MBL1196920.1 hypothetical protein [Chloroflexota bacterium]NOH14216.1 hypothetical protein [Chloroflexota bacterium]